MARMNRLFGVTMAERGVSQLVSVDLNSGKTRQPWPQILDQSGPRGAAGIRVHRGDPGLPNRAQVVSEMCYELVANMVRGAAGTEGMKFFPLIFALFMFVLIANLFGMVPVFFTVTSHIIITFALAMLVITTVVVYGFMRNGPKFLKLFVPAGVPAYVLPIVVPIELVSFLSRPISLSVRLFANMLAGHITLKVFAGFVFTMGTLGWLGFLGASLPLIMTIALTALELLVAIIQAYVFAVLTAMYLNDAIHPSH
jgi:F-type H+-transporting ATPase subunit a